MRSMLAGLLMLLVAANFSSLSAQEQTPQYSSAAIPDPNRAAPTDPSIVNGARGAVPPGGVNAANAANAGCCHDCHPQGCLLRKLWIWATYCPKERVCSYCPCCDRCVYKGVVPPYLYFLNPKCFEGSGVRPTFANECYRGCQNGQGCAAGAANAHP